MQNELKVDVRTRALRAADRVGSNGKLHDALDAPQPVSQQWWRRFFKWEHLTVAGREVKGFVITPSMALTIFLALGSVIGFMYNRMSGQIQAKDEAYQEQRDMLIEIRTELRIKKESDQKEIQRVERQIGDLAAWQQVTNKDLARVIPWRAPVKIERK